MLPQFLVLIAAAAAPDTPVTGPVWQGLWRQPFAVSAQVFDSAAAAARARGDSADLAMLLAGRAFLHSRLTGVAPALALLDTALATASDRHPVAQAFVHCTRASIRSFGGVPGAADDARVGLDRARASGSNRALGWCWHAIASVAINEAREPALILNALDSAAHAQRLAGDDDWLGITLFTQGYALHDLGRLEAAKRALGESRQLSETTQNRFNRAWTLRFLGDIHSTTGDWVSADREFRAANVDYVHLGDGFGLRSIRRVMASAAAAVGRLDEAEQTFGELLATAEAAGLAEAVYNTSLELAKVRWLRGDYDGSLALTERATAYGVRNGHPGMVAYIDYSRGLHALRLGRPADAERHLRARLSSADLQPTEHYAARARLAEALVRQGRLSEGVTELAAAMDRLDSLRTAMTDRDLRALVFQTRNSYDDPDFGLATIAAALVHAGQVETAFALSERRRARMLTDRLLRDRFAIGATNARSNEAVSATIDAAELRVALQPGTALVEFLVGRRGQPSVVFVASREEMVATVLPALDDLAGDIERFTALLTAGESADAVGRRVADRVVTPWLGLLPDGTRRLQLVPDDLLHRLPFDALPLGNGQHLLDNYGISIVPSAMVAMALQARPARTGGTAVLAFGDPRFAGEAELAGNVDAGVYREAFDSVGGLPRLRASASEARRVASHGTAARMVRLREDASEAFLKAVEPNHFGVIHFATHALVDERSSARTALALAPGDGEDGFLGSAELAALGLKADLVVLSACRTAGGVVVEGEGVQGLTAPFLEGGAGVVVATMWPVPDRAAARFVSEFYRALATGVSVGEALSTAKRARRDAGASAAEWAAFVAVGNAELTIPLRSSRNRSPLILTMIIAIVALAALRRRRLRAQPA